MPTHTGRTLVALSLSVLVHAVAPAAPASSAEHESDADAAVQDTWARYLFDFIPAIDACLAAAREPASIVRAWPMNHGMVGVHLVDGLEAHWTCVAEATGDSVASLEPAEEPTEPSVEPVFTRAPGAPPPGGCYRHEEVEAADGEVLGWLSFNVC